VTIVGGNDSADGNDSIVGSNAADVLFGNGGDDTLLAGLGNDTAVAGFGNDSWAVGNSDPLVLLNQGNDTLLTGAQFTFRGSPTVWGGQGDDSIHLIGASAALLFGNEGADTIDASSTGQPNLGAATLIGGSDTSPSGGSLDGNDLILGTAFRDSIVGGGGADTLRGNSGIDTISGGDGNDVFTFGGGGDDGDNAVGGGPVERITDANWDQDRFRAPIAVVFAANMGAGTGATLAESANNALTASAALSGNAANITAASFTFAGRSYLAINQVGAGFQDATDLLLDVTGGTGTIDTGDFIT
jgi:Ca2+-binding RTX toxin-like protein